MSSFSLDGKTAIITGGGSGIGESIAKVFAQARADVRILDLDIDGARRVANKITPDGGMARAYKVDVTVQEDLLKVCNDITGEDGRIDVAVCNAGIAHIGTLETTDEEDFDKLYNVNIKGVYNTMRGVIGQMKKQRSGVILNMASVAAEIGLPDRFAYSMTKAAVLNMTYTVARDFVDYGIRCNAISPGRVHTPFVDSYLKNNYPGKEDEMFEKLAKTQPIGRMAKPEEIAHLALYLCSDEASFITGSNYAIDGGFVKLNT